MFHCFRQSSAPKLHSVERKKGCHSYLTTVGLSQQHTDDVSCLQKSVYYFLQPIWTIPGRNGGLLWWLFSWRVLDLVYLDLTISSQSCTSLQPWGRVEGLLGCFLTHEYFLLIVVGWVMHPCFLTSVKRWATTKGNSLILGHSPVSNVSSFVKRGLKGFGYSILVFLSILGLPVLGSTLTWVVKAILVSTSLGRKTSN